MTWRLSLRKTPIFVWAMPSACHSAYFLNEETAGQLRQFSPPSRKRSKRTLRLVALRCTPPATHRSQTPTKESGPWPDAKDSRNGISLRRSPKVNCYNEQRHLWKITGRKRNCLYRTPEKWGNSLWQRHRLAREFWSNLPLSQQNPYQLNAGSAGYQIRHH